MKVSFDDICGRIHLTGENEIEQSYLRWFSGVLWSGTLRPQGHLTLVPERRREPEIISDPRDFNPGGHFDGTF